MILAFSGLGNRKTSIVTRWLFNIFHSLAVHIIENLPSSKKVTNAQKFAKCQTKTWPKMSQIQL